MALSLLALGALVLAAPRPDLDVAVPPGSPLEWTRAFPAITPARAPFAATGGEVVEPGRTVARPARSRATARVASSFGLLRILTWDLESHLGWTRGRRGEGLSARGDLPGSRDLLYWACMAPLLRLLLHGDSVSEAETLAHLIEIGEPVLDVLEAASSEKGLRDAARELRARIEPAPGAPFPAPGPADTREAMLERFVADELVREHPYDPEASFGSRVFLFGQELEPLVRRFVRSRSTLLRRNAVAALGRYATLDALEELAAVAAETEDPVVLVRALAALSRTGAPVKPDALVTRLRAEQRRAARDPVVEVALIGALGSMGAGEIVPDLLAAGRKALADKDTDRLMAVLAALARLPAGAHAEDLAYFADRVDHRVRANPRSYRPRREKGTVAPDRPDSPETCARILTQLVALIRARHQPGEPDHAEELLELAQEDPPGAPTWRGFANGALGRVQPYVRFLFLETLRELGPEGAQLLRRVARDGTVDPELRGFALAQLPWDDRKALAADLVADGNAPTAVRIQALEVLSFDGHPRLEELARALLGACAGLEPGLGRAEERYLYAGAVAALDARGALAAEDLLPLMHLPLAGVGQKGSLPLRVRELVVALVEAAARGARRDEVEARVEQVLDVVLAHRLNPRLGADTRDDARRFLRGQLEGLNPRKRDAAYEALVVDAVLEHVLGTSQVDALTAPPEFAPRVLLEEQILLALGRTGEPTAVAALLEVLHDRENPRRAEACLALGLAGDPAAAPDLARALLDDDPFTRYCAWESLRRLTGEDFFADWLHGPGRERAAAAEEYWRWVNERR